MSVVGECFFWYRLTRVVPDNVHRAVKWLCVCVCSVDIVTVGSRSKWGFRRNVQKCNSWHTQSGCFVKSKRAVKWLCACICVFPNPNSYTNPSPNPAMSDCYIQACRIGLLAGSCSGLWLAQRHQCDRCAKELMCYGVVYPRLSNWTCLQWTLHS